MFAEGAVERARDGAMMNTAILRKMIFVTGFPRGGTTWVRDCIGSHPKIAGLPGETTFLKPLAGYTLSALADHNLVTLLRSQIADGIARKVAAFGSDASYYVNKAPSDAINAAKAALLIPEAKFIFVIRDPRDVLVSHQRGARKWMDGKNSTVLGCMSKLERYFRVGYLDGEVRPNEWLVKYEDLHQDFDRTLRRLYDFIGVESDACIVAEVYRRNDFESKTGRRHKERLEAPARKGVVGDWANLLAETDLEWYKERPFWTVFMERFGYDWSYVTFESVLRAMVDAGMHFIGEEELLRCRLDANRRNALLLHTVDLAGGEALKSNVLAVAGIERALRTPSMFSFLALDHPRNQAMTPKDLVDVVRALEESSPYAWIGFHLDWARWFRRAEDEPVSPGGFDAGQALDDLIRQIDRYASYGMSCRIATVSRRGPGEAESPDKWASALDEFRKHGVRLIQHEIEPQLSARSPCRPHIEEEGGVITVEGFPVAGRINDPKTYKQFPLGSLTTFLTRLGGEPPLGARALGLRGNGFMSVPTGDCTG